MVVRVRERDIHGQRVSHRRRPTQLVGGGSVVDVRLVPTDRGPSPVALQRKNGHFVFPNVRINTHGSKPLE